MRFTFPTRETFNTLSSQPGETANFRDPESVKRFPWVKFIIIGGGIPILFTFIGGFFIYQDFTRTKTWDDTSAIVTRAELFQYRDSDGDLLYRPIVEFEYSRAGKMYTGDIGNQGGTSLRNSVHKTVERYPVGKRIIVKVNPNDAGESMIPGEVSIFMYFLAGFGLVLSAIFVGVGLFGLHKKNALLAAAPTRYVLPKQ